MIVMLLLAAGGIHTISSAMAAPDLESTITIMVKNDTAQIGKPTIKILSPEGGSPLGTCEDPDIGPNPVHIELSVGDPDPLKFDDSVITIFVNNQEIDQWDRPEATDPDTLGVQYTYPPDELDRTTFEEKEERVATLTFKAVRSIGTSDERSSSDEVIMEIKITNPCLWISSEPEGKMIPDTNFLLDLDDSDSATVSLNLADGCESTSVDLAPNLSNRGSHTDPVKSTGNNYEFDYRMEQEGHDSLKYSVGLDCGNPIDGGTP
jgi:hypothetical protein